MLKKLNDKFHHDAYTKFKEDVRSLGWGSQNSQRLRFRVMKEIGIKSGDSVLDVGCGFGDFYSYLIDLGIDTKYCGIDINQDFINCGIKKIKDNIELIHGDLDKVKNRKFDWSVASGIFSFDCFGWDEEVEQTIQKMFELSNKGVSINFLSKRSPHELKTGFRYACPSDFSKNPTSKFIVRHDYKDNDFTLYFYK